MKETAIGAIVATIVTVVVTFILNTTGTFTEILLNEKLKMQ